MCIAKLIVLDNSCILVIVILTRVDCLGKFARAHTVRVCVSSCMQPQLIIKFFSK